MITHMRKIDCQGWASAMFFKKGIISLFFLTISCLERKVSVISVYHPYVALKRCELIILSNTDRIKSFSIPIMNSNVLDISEDDLPLRNITVEKDSEYKFHKYPQKSENFKELLPCREQIIRIRYQIGFDEKILDIKFSGLNRQKFIINEGENGELSYIAK